MNNLLKIVFILFLSINPAFADKSAPTSPDPLCLEALKENGGVVKIAEMVELEGDKLIMKFSDETIIITPQSTFELAADYMEKYSTEIERDYLPIGAVLKFENGFEWVTLTSTYTTNHDGDALSCSSLILQIYKSAESI